jgi:hypothetical protein
MKKFIPPTVEEVKEYCRQKNIYVDAEDFIQFYGMKGWKVGKSPMINWHLAASRATKWDINRNKQPRPKPDKAAEFRRQRQETRDDYEVYLREKTTQALRDIDKKSQLYYVAGWLIEEILAERKGK